MKQHKVLYTFTPEQMELLSANNFTAHVDWHRILFTLEFKNLFMSQYEQDCSSMEIFIACGYNPDILDDNRIYGLETSMSPVILSPKATLTLSLTILIIRITILYLHSFLHQPCL